jgi:hypothetical protein
MDGQMFVTIWYVAVNTGFLHCIAGQMFVTIWCVGKVKVLPEDGAGERRNTSDLNSVIWYMRWFTQRSFDEDG